MQILLTLGNMGSKQNQEGVDHQLDKPLAESLPEHLLSNTSKLWEYHLLHGSSK